MAAATHEVRTGSRRGEMTEAQALSISADLRHLTPVGGLFCALAVAVGAVRGWADYDVFWHLANGRLMVERGRFPNPDVFSWSMPGGHYVAYSAPVDVLFYLLWNLGGALALGLFASVLFGLVVLPVALHAGRLSPHPLLESLVLTLFLFALLPYVGARPHMIAFALFGFLTLLLDRPLSWTATLVCAASLGAWAMIHGTFPFGFGLLAAVLLVRVVAGDLRSVLRGCVALVLGLTLSVLSPYGPQLWLYPLHTFGNPIQEYNLDWVSLRPLEPTSAATGLLLLGAIVAGFWKASDAKALAALGLLLPAIHTARFSPFLSILLAMIIAERATGRFGRLRSTALAELRRPWIAGWAFILIGIVVASSLLPPDIVRASSKPLPTTAVSTLIRCGVPGPVLNDYNWGGYLLWRGDGRYRVVIDGRAETLYSDRVIEDYMTVHRGLPGGADLVQRSPARYALIPPHYGVSFAELDGWRVVLSNTSSVLAVREGAVWRC